MAKRAKPDGKYDANKRSGSGSSRRLDDEALQSTTGGKSAQPAPKLPTTQVRFDPYKTFKFR